MININVPYVGTQLYEQVKEQLFDFGIYKDGEESYMHTSLVMQKFWEFLMKHGIVFCTSRRER